MPEATELEQQSKEAEEKSEASMHVHHRWAQATTLIQIAIALAAITILTRNRGLQVVSYVTAGASAIIGALAFSISSGGPGVGKKKRAIQAPTCIFFAARRSRYKKRR